MGFPKIGLESVLLISQFERNARKYNSTLDRMSKKTKQTFDAMSKSSAKAGRDIFAWTADFRRQMNEQDAAAAKAAAGVQNITTSLRNIKAVAATTAITLAAVGIALKKALDLGEEAAAIEDARISFQNLAASYGISASQMIAGLREASRGTIATSKLIIIANQALLSGGKEAAEALPQLYMIAEGAARAAGKTTLEVLQALNRGIAKGSPKLIDDAEVYIKLGHATEEFAKSAGKTVEQLTAQERQMATLLAVLDKGSEFTERLGSSAAAATDPFRRMNTTLESMRVGAATLLEPVFARLAKGIEGVALAAKFFTAFGIANIKTIANMGEIIKGNTTFVDQWRESFTEVFDVLHTGTRAIEDVESGVAGLGDAAEEATQEVDELSQKLADLAIQRGERLAKIELQNVRRDEDIAIRRARQLEDADRQLTRRREDMARDAAKARQDAARDNAKRLVEIEQENARRAIEFAKEAKRAREDLERQHQERLFQINQTADDTISEAARRNDAVAIAAAMRQRQRELRDEQRNSQLEKATLTRDLQEKQQRIDEDATIAKQKQQQRFAEQLASLQESEAQQEESLRLSLQRQDEDRALSWQRQEEDLKRSRDRQLEDLDIWYAKEQEKLKENLAKQTEIAVEGVNKAGVAIAQAATTAISRGIASTIGLSAEEQFRRRGTYLGAAVTPSTVGLSEEEQRRLRGSFLRRAEGGIDIVDRPTTFLAGEAGPEVAAFLPMRDVRAAHSFGDLNINHSGIPGGITPEAINATIYAAIVEIAQRLRLN